MKVALSSGCVTHQRPENFHFCRTLSGTMYSFFVVSILKSKPKCQEKLERVPRYLTQSGKREPKASKEWRSCGSANYRRLKRQPLKPGHQTLRSLCCGASSAKGVTARAHLELPADGFRRSEAGSAIVARLTGNEGEVRSEEAGKCASILKMAWRRSS